MEQIELKINGMSCGHCVMALKKELGKIPEINIVNVEVGKALIETNDPVSTKPEIEKAVLTAGFSLIP